MKEAVAPNGRKFLETERELAPFERQFVEKLEKIEQKFSSLKQPLKDLL